MRSKDDAGVIDRPCLCPPLRGKLVAYALNRTFWSQTRPCLRPPTKVSRPPTLGRMGRHRFPNYHHPTTHYAPFDRLPWQHPQPRHHYSGPGPCPSLLSSSRFLTYDQGQIATKPAADCSSKLKQCRVIPIFKSGNATECDNYRPISLLSSISKVLAKIVAEKLIHHLISNNLLYQHQYGFLPKRCVFPSNFSEKII